MKNKIIWPLLAFVLMLSSCTDKETQIADIKLVPVYAISSIIGTNAPYSIEVYKEKALMLVYSNNVNVKALSSSNYIDASTETDFNVTFRAAEKTKSVLGIDSLINSRYELRGVKATGISTLKVVSYIKTDSIVTNYTAKTAEAARYN